MLCAEVEVKRIFGGAGWEWTKVFDPGTRSLSRRMMSDCDSVAVGEFAHAS